MYPKKVRDLNHLQERTVTAVEFVISDMQPFSLIFSFFYFNCKYVQGPTWTANRMSVGPSSFSDLSLEGVRV